MDNEKVETKENESGVNLDNNESSKESENKRDIILRFIVVLLAVTFWMFYRIFYLTDTNSNWDFKHCFKDKLVLGLSDITYFLSQNLHWRDLLTISGSNLLDVFYVTFLILFIKKGNSWTPICHFALFFGIRNIVIQSMIVLEFYDTFLFLDPGFPSVVVPFGRASDFFYSGHAGSPIILGLQFADMGYSHLKLVGFVLALYEGFVMMVVRAHYSIDVLFGLLMAHYTYFLCKPVGTFLDKHLPFCKNGENAVNLDDINEESGREKNVSTI